MKKQFTSLFAGLALLALAACSQKPETIEVKWATFNVRYDNPEDSLNNWKYRKDTVANFIKAHNLDVVGMQEVLHNQLEDLKARLPEYAEVGVGRDDGKPKENMLPYSSEKTALTFSTAILSGSLNIQTALVSLDGTEHAPALQHGQN